MNRRDGTINLLILCTILVRISIMNYNDKGEQNEKNTKHDKDRRSVLWLEKKSSQEYKNILLII